MSYQLKSEQIEAMFRLASFEIPDDDIVFVGLRGASPVNVSGSDFEVSHKLNDKGADYLHMRCTLIQWRPKEGLFAVFPGSTVPHRRWVRWARPRGLGGEGANSLVTCFLRKNNNTDRRYFEGDHGLSSKLGPHRAFRNESKLPVLRTGDDLDYEGNDLLEYAAVFDNLHCARQENVHADRFSSAGCQVVAGLPGDRTSTGRARERGPWRIFIKNAYDSPQERYAYALFEEGEAERTAELGKSNRSATVRFGSTGPLVEHLQNGLMDAGFDIGPAGADGDFGYATLDALKLFQLDKFGADDVDLIAGPTTAAELGISWPEAGSTVLTEVHTPAPARVGADQRGAKGQDETYNSEYNLNFGTLTPGGFYSSQPNDMGIPRAIRANNPGALNVTSWQKNFPGFVGTTQSDRAGNVTSIYRTPEHGVGAWYHLLTDRYRYGKNGTLVVGTLARRYAGVESVSNRAAQAYIGGWKRFSNGQLDEDTRIRLSNDDGVLLLARAMFAHEIGSKSPLQDAQILNAVQLKRSDKLPV